MEWSWGRSRANWTLRPPLCRTTWKSSRTRTSFRFAGRARFFAIPPIPPFWKSCWASFTQSAVPATRPSNLQRSSANRERKISMDVKERVREKYGEAALRVKSGGSSCCGSAPSSGSCVDPITSNLYDSNQTSAIPEEAVLASLGCGNPTALAKLNPGEIVLDLGSGGGIDVLLSARRVGPTGKAYGLDMTHEMLALAHENQRKA